MNLRRGSESDNGLARPISPYMGWSFSLPSWIRLEGSTCQLFGSSPFYPCRHFSIFNGWSRSWIVPSRTAVGITSHRCTWIVRQNSGLKGSGRQCAVMAHLGRFRDMEVRRLRVRPAEFPHARALSGLYPTNRTSGRRPSYREENV